MRDITITRNFTRHAEGSVLVGFGDTRVICTASVEQGVPRFAGQGAWLGDSGVRHVAPLHRDPYGPGGGPG